MSCLGAVACASPGAGSGAEPLEVSSATGIVIDLTSLPLEGCRVCIDGRTTGCTDTDAEGKFTLHGIPDQSQVLLRLEAAGHVPGLRMVNTGVNEDISLGWTVLPSFEDVVAQRALLGIEDVAGTGFIAFLAVDHLSGPLQEVSIRAQLQPADADGPFYFEAQAIRPGLEAGAEGAGYFYNVPPGDHAVSVTTAGTEMLCNDELLGLGWGRAPGSDGLLVPVRADTMTFVVPVCDL